ncbi:MAG: 30S ribosomal protein S4e [Candidatus Aenigmarchaeota archaeon]|nr:30S ribosomal protein S4e [Candidatus Aenigmarchaeota archaeon]
MAHLKRYKMPGFWGLGVKGGTFVVRPRGPHSKGFCIPLQVAVRDLLGYATSAKEAKSIISQGKILVDKKPRKDSAFAIGFMDTVEIPGSGKSWVVDVGSKGLFLKESPKQESKLCKIIGKTSVKGGKNQLNLHDGRNIIAAGEKYKTGDTLKISLPKLEVLDHFPLKKGSDAIIVSGKNMGVRGTITAITERKYMLEKAAVTLDADGKKAETLRKYVFVIGGKGAAKPGKGEVK